MFTHPAVDIVSTSYGGLGVDAGHVPLSHEGVVQRGKLHFGAAPNSPTLTPSDGTSGPWWSIAVGGFHEGTSQGRQATSGYGVDFVAQHTKQLPYCSACETGTASVGGTSFATPRAAGTASRVLLEARRRAGHSGPGPRASRTGEMLIVNGTAKISGWQFRRALEEAAAYPRTSDFQASHAPSQPTGVPVVDGVAPVQIGWGLLSPDPSYGVVGEALAGLGFGKRQQAQKSHNICTMNTALLRTRHAYWDRLAAGSASFGSTSDPYIYC